MTEKKITIKGVPPSWDQLVFERKLEDWINVYRGTEQSMELVRANFEHELLQAVIDKAKHGYTITANKRVHHSELDHSVWMVKPYDQQVADIENIKVKVKAEYVSHLEVEREKYEDLLRQQLIQAQEEKDRKFAEQVKAKQLAAIEKQVKGCYAPLVIPD